MSASPSKFTHMTGYIYSNPAWCDVPDTVYFNADELRCVWDEVKPLLEARPDIANIRLRSHLRFEAYTSYPGEDGHEPCPGWRSGPLLQFSPHSVWLILFNADGAVAEAHLVSSDCDPKPNPAYREV